MMKEQSGISWGAIKIHIDSSRKNVFLHFHDAKSKETYAVELDPAVAKWLGTLLIESAKASETKW